MESDSASDDDEEENSHHQFIDHDAVLFEDCRQARARLSWQRLDPDEAMCMCLRAAPRDKKKRARASRRRISVAA